MYPSFLKRLFDLCFSVFVLLLLSPIILLLVLVILLKLGTPILFTQYRPGLNGRIFKIYKFRSMNDHKDKNGQLLPDMERLTPFGMFLRRSSLDELPALLNVIKGEMSLVGPRPLLVQYLPLYNEEQKKRHQVKPGITGWAQVNGRNTISWAKKFEYDVWYVHHLSFRLDIRILYLTVIKVIKSEGIDSSRSTTMDTFTG